VNAADIPPAPRDAEGETLTVARNVSTRYLAIVVEAILGLVVLPFNVAHLGTSAYGLWMLTASVTAYFSVLDLGYSGALVKFVAQYRARRDYRALNEILSTTFVVFATFGVVTYLVAIAIAVYLGRIFQLSPEQIHIGRIVLLIISLNVAAGTAFSVFGGVINGFQRYDLNNIVGTVSSVVTAVVNVAVLAAGYGLIELVAATTVVRVLTYLVYRANAYRVFPGLRIRLGWFRRERLREVTMFSVYMLLIDWANKMNYSVDALVIGAFLSTTAVAVWTVGQRLAEVTQRLTNQLNDVLFPTVVDNDSADRMDRLQAIFIQGTRLSLATVVPMGGAMMLMAGPLVMAWVGPEFSGSVLVLRLLTLSVIVRVGSATAGTLLKGAGEHRLVAFTNVGAAFVNVALSIAMVKPFGLTGVAIGTLVPICMSSLLVLFPAACRRVQLSIGRAVAEAVWPAVWPAVVMTAFVLATRDMIPVTLVAIGAQMAAAGLIYAAVFVFFGINAMERRFYLSKAKELIQRRPAPEPVTEGA
jgi:O-antigen/teichoic acid export membrane protein